MEDTSLQTATGTVRNFDTVRGVASVVLPAGEELSLVAGAFFSGRPGRLPAAGDKVSMSVRSGPAGRVVLVARLIKAR